MKKGIFLLLLCFSGNFLFSQKEIALSFEKLPYMEPLGFWSPREVSNQVLRTLEPRGIQAIGFVVGEKIEEIPISYVVLEDWAREGHLLGNGTYAYVDFNLLSVRDFLGHVADGEKFVRRATRLSQDGKFFRFPMLHVGGELDKRRDAEKALTRADYRIVPATVVFSDYQFNFFFQDVFGDREATERLRSLYLSVLERALENAEKQSEKVYGRQIPQILRMHLGLATGHFLDAVLELLESRGYKFVTITQALSDPAYEESPDYGGEMALGFIDQVAAARNLTVDPGVGEISRREIEEHLQP